jgi:hypothetical protein
LQGFFYSTGKDELEKKPEVKLVEIKSPLRAAKGKCAQKGGHEPMKDYFRRRVNPKSFIIVNQKNNQ